MRVAISGLVPLGQVCLIISQESLPDHHTDLKFRIVLRMSIIGVVTHPEMSTQISDVACPFELPADSV